MAHSFLPLTTGANLRNSSEPGNPAAEFLQMFFLFSLMQTLGYRFEYALGVVDPGPAEPEEDLVQQPHRYIIFAPAVRLEPLFQGG